MTARISKFHHNLTLGVCAAALSAAGGLATGSSANDAETADEVIVVTAQRREENIQRVPLSLTAIGGDTLRSVSLTTSNDLGQFIPGVEIRAVSGNEMAKTFIRGSGSVDFNPNANPTVGVYLDEVYLPNQFQHTTQTYDLQRIEALRGPQGTLYGRNATAGAINYITAKPSQEASAYLETSYGNYNAVELTGAATGPLTDTLSGRVAFIYTADDGWMKNRGAPDAGVPADDHLNEDDTYSWRGSLLWEPSSNAEVYFNVHGHKAQGDAFSYQMIGSVDPDTFETDCDYRVQECINFYGYSDPDGVEENGDPTAGDFDLVGDTDTDSFGSVLRGDWDFEGFTLTSITAYEEYSRDTPNDVDASPAAISHNFFGMETSAWSQEVRLASNTSGPLDWIVGVYYAADDLLSDNEYVFFAPSTTFQHIDQDQTSAAVFASGGYQINDVFKLNLGVRYTKDEIDFYHQSTRYSDPDAGIINDFAPGDIDGTEADLEFDAVTWKVGLEATPTDDLLLYATVSTGYKSGGVGVGFGDPQEVNIYDEEDLTAYEAGLKSTFFDGRARFNASAFFYDYEDLQAFDQTTGPFGQVNILSNAPKAEYYGFEAELAATVADGLDVSLGLAHLDTEFKEFLRPTTSEDLAGNENVFSPPWKFTGRVDYERPAELFVPGFIQASFDVSWTDSVYHSVENDPLIGADSYWLGGGRLGFEAVDGRFGVGLWSRNIFHTVYRVQSFDIRPSGWIISVPNKPRTYGAELILRW